MDIKKLLNFWDKVITGANGSRVEDLPEDKDVLKDLLYQKTLSVIPEVVESFDININFQQVKEKVMKDIFNSCVQIESEPWSFFPQRMIEPQKATCAGNTLIVNYLLNSAGIDFEYGRPEGHSLNFVYLNSDAWWLDATNNVIEKVEYTDKEIDGLKVRELQNDNPRIPYRLVRILQPRDIIINVFGNMGAMISAAQKGKDKYAIEIMNKYGDEIEKIDFEKWLFYLYPEYMKYTTQNKEFLEEVERIKKWQK